MKKLDVHFVTRSPERFSRQSWLRMPKRNKLRLGGGKTKMQKMICVLPELHRIRIFKQKRSHYFRHTCAGTNL
jgi:hypothetical protein